MLRRALSLLLTACALCALLVPSSLAAYHLSQDPDGTESFLYSPTLSHTLTLLPPGTVVRSDLGNQIIVERFTYRSSSGYWELENTLTSQEHLTVRDHNYIYHVITQDPHSNQAMDAGVWVRASGSGGLNTTTITGEPVDEWAVDLVNEAIAMNLMPARLKGQDLCGSISRLQFASLAERLYEPLGGVAISAPSNTPYTYTTDP